MVIAKSLLLNNRPVPADSATHFGVSRPYIAKAQVVLEHASDLETAVRLGIEPLNDAYATASVNKQKSDDEQSAVDQLRKEHPDLADLVDDGEIKLAEAIKIRDERREDKKRAERIAPIDLLVAESGGRTFAERVEAGEITWAEAESLATKWKTEWEEAAERNKRRIFDILAGWGALTRFLDAPDDSFNKVVLEKLGANFRADIKKITAGMAENATKWNGAI